MYSLLGLFTIVTAFCDAAALPKNLRSRLAKDIGEPELALHTQLDKRSVENSSLVVALELVNSGYCGNISIGSQEKSVVTLFDLNASQLSAVAPDAQFCVDSDSCTSTTNDIECYDPSLSETATDLSDSFELSISTNITFTGVFYEDSISLGGLTIPKQPFGLAHKIRGSHGYHSKVYSYAGVAGLSSCDNSTTELTNDTSFIGSLFSDGHIQSPGFSLWMNPISLIGELLFGAVDSSRYSGSLYLFDLVNPSSWYSIYLTKISSSVKACTETFSQVEMIFDTSISGIILPRSWQTGLSTFFSGSVNANNTLLIPCSSNSTETEIDFVVGNGFTISIPISALIGTPTGTDGMCLSSFSFTDDTRYAFGTSFLRYVYLVLNTKTSQGAIAQASFTVSNNDLTFMTPSTPLPLAIVYVVTVVDNASVSASLSANATSALTYNGTSNAGVTTAVLLATTGAVVTETVVTTIVAGTSSSVITSVVTVTVSDSTTSSTNTIKTPVDEHVVDTTSTVPTTTTTPTIVLGTTATAITDATSRTAGGFVASAQTDSTATDPSSSEIVQTILTSRTIGGAVATGATSATTSPTASDSAATTSSTSSGISRTNAVLIVTTTSNGVLVVTTTADATSPAGTATTPVVTKVVSTVNGVVITSSSTIPARATNRLDVPFTSSGVIYSMPAYSTPWPSVPININIYIQNTIILTTTHRYAPENWADVVTVTSTATVTTTVPCSTDSAVTSTLTARVLQVLIVPSPTPYVDVECSCTKHDIIYVDEQSVTKTIYVQAATPVIQPTQQPTLQPVETDCECTECYYTVKKTRTVTALCTATPTVKPTALPTFISGAGRVAVSGLGSMVAIVMALALMW